LSDKVYLGLNAGTLETAGTLSQVSRINLLIDSGAMYTSGTDDGRVVEVSVPWGTQAMADHILAGMKGVTYRPYTVQDALLDPAAEIGDGITVGGTYSAICQTGLSFDRQMTATVSAPTSDEVEEEYPYQTKAQRKASRQLSETRSRITKTAEEIRLEVKNEVEGLAASIDIQLDGITSTVKGQGEQISAIHQTVGGITAKVTGLEGSYSSLKQYVDSITLSVSNGATSSTIALKAGSATIQSQTIKMDGLVTFTGLSDGTTTINGACIKTGTIDAKRLNLSGAITFDDLNSGVKDSITGAQEAAAGAQSAVSGWTYSGTTYIDGSKIMTGTVTANTLRGRTINLLNPYYIDKNDKDNPNYDNPHYTHDSYYAVSGTITVGNAATAGYAVELSSREALRLRGEAGALYLESGYGNWCEFSIDRDADRGLIQFGNADIGPANWQLTCGTINHRWDTVYTVSSPIVTSDRNQKHDISYDIAGYDALFDALKPASFGYNDGQSGRTHLGMISQDVEEAMEACGLSSLDFAGFIKSPVLKDGGEETGEYDYSLRYDEFIPLCIRQIQLLKARVEQLEVSM